MALKKTEVWINKSESGKGFYIRLPEGKMYTGSLETLKKFVAGNVKGVNLSEIVEDGENSGRD